MLPDNNGVVDHSLGYLNNLFEGTVNMKEIIQLRENAITHQMKFTLKSIKNTNLTSKTITFKRIQVSTANENEILIKK